ncbi:MAG: AraC family transcriptional regulator [Fibrobacterota bacterium]|nr:AraC family transcriptional regulator [Fibrobacterota bacterium]
MPPKTYARLVCFQKAVLEIEKSGRADWLTVARVCGFYDQAHFIHDLKRFSGFTPLEYFKRKSKDLNYVPVG